MEKAKYATVSVREHREEQWIASFPYVSAYEERDTDPNGNAIMKPVWKTKRRVLKTTGRDKGRSHRIRDAARLEAEELREKLNEEDSKARGTMHGVTVAEHVAWYIDHVRVGKKGIGPTTLTGYRTLLKHSIAPFIGDLGLQALTEDHVIKWLEALQEEKSAATAAKAFVLLRGALKEARKAGLIAENPTDDISKPKAPKKTTHNALDEVGRGKVATYIDIDPTDPVSLAIRLSLFTGMREAEICGLRWRNVSIEGLTLRVVESLGKARKDDVKRYRNVVEVYSGVFLKEPKNEGSIRTIAFPKGVAQALKARRSAMKADCAALGVPFDDSLFVVGKVDGKPMHPHSLWRRWNALVTAMGLLGTEGKTPTFHDVRHTYATTAIANGIDVKTVSNQMGHKDAAMTLNTYATVDPDAARRAAERMGDVIASNMRSAKGMGEVLEFGKTGTEA